MSCLRRQESSSLFLDSRFHGNDVLEAHCYAESIWGCNKKMRLILFVSLLIASIFLSAVCGHANDDFADKYRTYKDHVQSASSAFQKKDYSSAITNYSKAIEMSPFEINNYYNRGIAFYKSEKEKEAEMDFDKGIIMDPKMSSAYVYRGLCREKLGKYKEALSDYTKALELKPNDAAVHNNIAYLYVSANDESFRDKANPSSAV